MTIVYATFLEYSCAWPDEQRLSIHSKGAKMKTLDSAINRRIEEPCPWHRDVSRKAIEIVRPGDRPDRGNPNRVAARVGHSAEATYRKAA